SFQHTFAATLPLTHNTLTQCYSQHQSAVFEYFKGRDDLLSIDISEPGSLLKMKQFLGMKADGNSDFPKLNVGRNVASWKEYKHPNKINSNLAGIEHRKYFDYALPFNP
ncbi:MAG: sulfotransferase family protein, partial [Psychrosphaera sp.]|nr:sulfotransferase family protein [Psychrosphaera sp.]